MTYEFLNKAQSQPDLNDFCEYVKKPLQIIEDIRNQYLALQNTKKAEKINIEINHKLESILNNHLPEMVETYCNFSFDYRNNKKIDINNISLTPKELLLKNLSKVIEEVELIEKEFNHNNAFNAVVQNKVLEKFGYQPEVCLATNSITNKGIQLENKFDYDKFIETNQFKKAPIELNKVPEVEDEPKSEEITTKKTRSFFSLIEILLVVGILSTFGIFTHKMYESTSNGVKSSQFMTKILNQSNNIQQVYSNVSSFEGLGNKVVINTYAATPDELLTPWGKKMHVKSYTVNKEHDSYVIEVPLSNDDISDSCPLIINAMPYFDIVKIDNTIVKTNGDTNTTALAEKCTSANHEKVSFIKTIY